MARLSGIDLTDLDVWEAGTPHHWFAMLRREDPVHWQPERDGPGFWCVTRHADVAAVHRDHRTFSSEAGGTSLEDVPPGVLDGRKSMLDLDPPRHDELRALVQGAFTPRAVRRSADMVRELAAGVVAGAVERERVDFVHDLAAVIPMRVLATKLGVPHSDHRLIIDIGDRILGASDPEFVDPEERSRHRELPFSSPAALEMFEYSRALAARRRADPRDDVVTRLALGEIGGRRLPQHEFDLYLLLLATAGNETARHTISHGMLGLLAFPDEWERFRADPGLGDGLVEELLRWATPLHHFRRTVTAPVTLGGQQLEPGDKVATWLVSANRDEAVFAHPGRLDITRAPNPHVAFGPGGVHYCLGAGLARLELRIVFEELLLRLGTVELRGRVDRLRSNFFHGVKRMPVRLAPPRLQPAAGRADRANSAL